MASFRAMLHSESDRLSRENYKAFSAVAGKPLLTYFNNNWLNCKEVWILKDRALVTTLQEHCTNRVESCNRKLKLVFSVDTPLFEAVEGLVSVVQGNRMDALRHKDHEALCKKVYISYCSDETVYVICNDLTMHAAKILCEQCQLALKPSPAKDRHSVTLVDCTCILFRTIRIPCRHIIRERMKAGTPWYNKDERWWKQYNISGVDKAPPVPKVHSETIQPRMPGHVKRILGPSEKFKLAAPITHRLSSILANYIERSLKSSPLKGDI